MALVPDRIGFNNGYLSAWMRSGGGIFCFVSSVTKNFLKIPKPVLT